MADHRRPEDLVTGGHPGDARPRSSPDTLTHDFVWPPPDEEVDAWEVVPLSGDVPAASGEAPAEPPQARVPPPPVSTALPDAAQSQTVTVRLAGARGPVAGSNRGEIAPDAQRPDPEPRATPPAAAASAPRSLMLFIVLVPLLAVLSTGAGFLLALWMYPSLVAPATSQAPESTLILDSPQPGLQVRVNGELRGKTPLELSVGAGQTRIEIDPTLPAGTSTPALPRAILPTSGEGSDAASESQTPDVPAPPPPSEEQATPAPVAVRGYLTVRSGIPVRVLLEGRRIGTSSDARIALPAGAQVVQFVAQEFEFVTSRDVIVPERGTVSVSIDLPNGVVTLDSEPSAEVWLGNRRLGTTPLTAIEVPIGAHEVVFRHPQLGERRESIVVRVLTPTELRVTLTP